MSGVKYLFYGFGSEYVLHPLFLDLTRLNFDCIEIEALKTKDSQPLITKLKGEKIIFITSAHLLLDKVNFSFFYPNKNNFFGVMEILQYLKPLRAVYIPHDLTQPLIDYEESFIGYFDIFLSPCEPFTSIYSQFVKTEEVGWIKYHKNLPLKFPLSKNKSLRAIWFLSDYVLHQKMGEEKSFDLLKPVLDQGVAIKFPNWFEVNKFEEYFKNKGVTVYSSTLNTIDLILSHNLIITNGLSSINSESYFLGKTTVNIKEGSYYGEKMVYLNELLPELIYIDKISEFKLESIDINRRNPILKPFNEKKVINLLTN